MIIDKIKKINCVHESNKNKKAADMLIGKWVKCDCCKEILYKEDVHKNYSVCPKCGKHFRLSARRRIAQIIDEETFIETNENMQTKNTLNFEGYEKKIETIQEKTHIKEAVKTGFGEIFRRKSSNCSDG